MNDDKVLIACHRIEELYHDTKGQCYVSFSGGKDSTVILALIKLCIDALTLPKQGIRAVFSDTGVELGITREFVDWCKEEYYPNIEIIRPKESFATVINKYGKPMLSKIKSHDIRQWQSGEITDALFENVMGKNYAKRKIGDKDIHILDDEFPIRVSEKCCDALKKKPFHDYEKKNEIGGAIVGIRIQEGGAREINALSRVKKGGKLCQYNKDGVIYKAPIIDWTTEDVDLFVKEYHVPLNRAYTEFGFSRTGCMACPFSLNIKNDLKYLFYNEPSRYKAAMLWMKDVYIAQGIKLPFDEEYEKEYERLWKDFYEPMRQRMLRKYRPESWLIKYEMPKDWNVWKGKR